MDYPGIRGSCVDRIPFDKLEAFFKENLKLAENTKGQDFTIPL